MNFEENLPAQTRIRVWAGSGFPGRGFRLQTSTVKAGKSINIVIRDDMSQEASQVINNLLYYYFAKNTIVNINDANNGKLD